MQKPTPAFMQSFSYDELNRLTRATEVYDGVLRGIQTFQYDQYGNRWFDANNTTPALLGPIQSQADYAAANNRLVKPGYNSYDAVGNLLAIPGSSYSYDAENRLVSVNGGAATYVYDGEGRRVKKIVGGVTTRMVYNHLGELIAEYDAAGTLQNEYVYRAGELVATLNPITGVHYATPDRLGSPRIWTDRTGAVVAGGRHDYLPFGEELLAGAGVRTVAQGYPSTAQGDGKRIQFTQKERDVETGLDYFDTRYYGSVLGRFMSPDDVRNDSSPSHPQSWNLYAYGRNNPLRFTDPTGEAVRAYDPSGNILCEDTECGFDAGGNLIINEIRYSPDRYTISDPNPSAVVYDRPEPHEMSSFATGVIQGLEARRKPSLQLIGGFAGVSAAAGGIAGATAYGLGISLVGGTTTLGLAGSSTTILTNPAAGQIIGWGVGQAGAQATRQLTQSLTREAVQQMIAKGLNRATVENLLAQYSRAIAEGGARLQNAQLLPRYELMKKILELWPGK